MFDQLANFWDQILSVFIPSSGTLFGFTLSQGYGGVNLVSTYDFLLARLQFARLFSYLSLVGLSVFLFYQVYKVIHAFVGGFYE